MKENVLVIGSGGREHALAWKLAQSSHVEKVYCAPGNAGTHFEEKIFNISIGTSKDDFSNLFNFTRESKIGMVVVGPEAPLANGIVDYFNSLGYFEILGPTQAATELEADKFLSFDVNVAAGNPQARGIKCNTLEEVICAIPELATDRGVVLKARGLTEGKGVTVYDSKEQAMKDAAQFFETYGKKDKLRIGVLVSQRLFGLGEYSVFALSDGDKATAFRLAVQDHKPRDDNDLGPNTGGMGAYSPVSIVSNGDLIMTEEIMNRAIHEMTRRGTIYRGVLYAGMMLTREGPKVIEFNARFGDPETQSLMMMLKSDLFEHFKDTLDGKFDNTKITHNPGAACGVVLASHGYPGSYKKGLLISGLDEANEISGVKIFHAGTALNPEGKIVSSGGRVLCVNGYSENGLVNAISKAYLSSNRLCLINESYQRVEFQRRNDIGQKGLRQMTL